MGSGSYSPASSQKVNSVLESLYLVIGGDDRLTKEHVSTCEAVWFAVEGGGPVEMSDSGGNSPSDASVPPAQEMPQGRSKLKFCEL